MDLGATAVAATHSTARHEVLHAYQMAEDAFAIGNLSESVKFARQALQQAPTFAPAHLLLSTIAFSGGQLRLAVRDLLRASEHATRQPATLIAAIALRLISLGETGAALKTINDMDTASIQESSVLFDLAQQLTLLEQHGVALQFLEEVESRGGETFLTAYFRGNAMKFMGRMDDAERAFERSIALKSEYCHSHWALAFLGRVAGAARRANRIQALITGGVPTDADRCYLEYAQYRELEMLGDDVAAWNSLEHGFRSKRRTIRHDVATETKLFDLVMNAFPSLPPPQVTLPEESTPIFIVGMPRTGTTLLERILGNSDAIALCGELNDLRMQYKWVTDYYCPGYFDARSLAEIGTVDFHLFGRRYLEHVKWRAPGAPFFTDKNPGNFVMIGAILRALPHARIIHLRRDPLDACFSNLKELFAANAYAYSYDLHELAAHHRNYARLMEHWQEIAPGRILDLRYEDLVTEPELQTQRVMQYLELPYSSDLVHVEVSNKIVSTASSVQVREPIHSRNIGGWRRYAQQLQPLADALGRDTDN